MNNFPPNFMPGGGQQPPQQQPPQPAFAGIIRDYIADSSSRIQMGSWQSAVSQESRFQQIMQIMHLLNSLSGIARQPDRQLTYQQLVQMAVKTEQDALFKSSSLQEYKNAFLKRMQDIRAQRQNAANNTNMLAPPAQTPQMGLGGAGFQVPTPQMNQTAPFTPNMMGQSNSQMAQHFFGQGQPPQVPQMQQSMSQQGNSLQAPNMMAFSQPPPGQQGGHRQHAPQQHQVQPQGQAQRTQAQAQMLQRVKSIANSIKQNAMSHNTMDQLVQKALSTIPQAKQQELRSNNHDFNHALVEFYVDEQAKAILRQQMHKQQSAQMKPPQQQQQNPQFQPNQLQAMQNLLQQRTSGPQRNAQGEFDFSQIAGQLADAQRLAEAGADVVPASNNGPRNPNFLGNSKMGAPTQFATSQDQARAQAQAQMNQQRPGNNLHGMNGGLHTPHQLQQPSPAMRHLNQPMVPPRGPGSTTPQQSGTQQPAQSTMGMQQPPHQLGNGSNGAPNGASMNEAMARAIINEDYMPQMQARLEKMSPEERAKAKSSLRTRAIASLQRIQQSQQSQPGNPQQGVGMPRPMQVLSGARPNMPNVANLTPSDMMARGAQQQLPQGQQRDAAAVAPPQAGDLQTQWRIVQHGNPKEKIQFASSLAFDREHVLAEIPGLGIPLNVRNWGDLNQWASSVPQLRPDQKSRLEEVRRSQVNNYKNRLQTQLQQAMAMTPSLAQQAQQAPFQNPQGISPARPGMNVGLEPLPPHIAAKLPQDVNDFVRVQNRQPVLRPMEPQEIQRYRERARASAAAAPDRVIVSHIYRTIIQKATAVHQELGKKLQDWFMQRFAPPQSVQQQSQMPPSGQPQMPQMPQMAPGPSMGNGMGMLNMRTPQGLGNQPQPPFANQMNGQRFPPAANDQLNRPGANQMGMNPQQDVQSQIVRIDNVPGPNSHPAMRKPNNLSLGQPLPDQRGMLAAQAARLAEQATQTQLPQKPQSAAQNAEQEQFKKMSEAQRTAIWAEQLNLVLGSLPPKPPLQNIRHDVLPKLAQMTKGIRDRSGLILDALKTFFIKFGDWSKTKNLLNHFAVLQQQMPEQGQFTESPALLHEICTKLHEFYGSWNAKMSKIKEQQQLQQARNATNSSQASHVPDKKSGGDAAAAAAAATAATANKRPTSAKAPPAPIDGTPPFAIGAAPSPHGTPMYGTTDFSRERMSIPDKKKAKLDKSRGDTQGAAPQMPPQKQVPPQHIQLPQPGPMSRRPQAQEAVELLEPVYEHKCSVPNCEFQAKGFQTVSECEVHERQVHQYEKQPLAWCLKKMREAMGIPSGPATSAVPTGRSLSGHAAQGPGSMGPPGLGMNKLGVPMKRVSSESVAPSARSFSDAPSAMEHKGKAQASGASSTGKDARAAQAKESESKLDQESDKWAKSKFKRQDIEGSFARLLQTEYFAATVQYLDVPRADAPPSLVHEGDTPDTEDESKTKEPHWHEFFAGRPGGGLIVDINNLDLSFDSDDKQSKKRKRDGDDDMVRIEEAEQEFPSFEQFMATAEGPMDDAHDPMDLSG